MFDKIKSLFVIEDEAAEAKKSPAIKGPKSRKETTTSTPPEVVNTPDTTEPTASPKGKISEKFVNVLFGAMDKANLDGFDYLEFKQSLRNLDKMGMDEPTKYKSAFAMAQTMGATPEKLVQTAGHYVKVLQNEEQKFGQALANQRQKQIGGKEAALKKLEDTVKHKKQQIAQLQKEIQQHEAQIAGGQKEIGGARLKVETTRKNFEVTYNKIVSQIMTDIENIKQYLTSSKG